MRHGRVALLAAGMLGSAACEKSPSEPEVRPQATAVVVDPLLQDARLLLEADPADIVAQSVVELMVGHPPHSPLTRGSNHLTELEDNVGKVSGGK